MRGIGGQRGFTVLEALIGLSVFLIVLIAVFSIYEKQRSIHAKGERKVEVQQNARLAMARITREIRMTGYFPENFRDPEPPIPLANPIHVATESELAIYGDADDTGETNVFLYCLDGDVLRKSRRPDDLPEAYDCDAGDVLAENIFSLRFRYYDEDNVSIHDPEAVTFQLDDQPAGAAPDFDETLERSAVRRIVISLTARMDHMLQGPQSYTLTSDVWLRNP